MPDSYELRRLTDVDFENVAHDIFERELKLPLELFAPGRDQGVDLRYLSRTGRSNLIIQCKHWAGTGSTKLYNHLVRHELPKVRRLAPTRYILVTSASVTMRWKQRVLDSFAPFIMQAGDIVGNEDLQSLLQSYPDIVRRHLRLWLTDANVLRSVLNQNVHLRSMALADEARETLRLYVPNASHDRARELLERDHVCIVAGVPGIGKTTLAQVMATEYAHDNFELVAVSEDIDEADRVWNPNGAQFFYYDDFLGQTTLEDKLGKNEDQRLVSFMNRIRLDANKRLVLTTREYILEQARSRYEPLARKDFDPLTCVIDLADYTTRIRADILYNHIFFSKLNQRTREFLGRPEIYTRIIYHQNYSPRLVDLSIRSAEAERLTPTETARHILTALDDPSSLWDHAVRRQLSDSDRGVLFSLATLPPSVEYSDLEHCWRSYVSAMVLKPTAALFRDSLHTLDGTMIKTSSFKNQVFVRFHNPSVRDYVTRLLLCDANLVQIAAESVVSFDQVFTFRRLAEYSEQGPLLLANLLPAAKELDKAIVATFRIPDLKRETLAGSFHGRTHPAARLGTALWLAERLPLPRSQALISRYVGDPDRLLDSVVDYDELTRLADLLARSTELRLNRLALPFADWLVDIIIEPTYSLEEMRFALDSLQGLSDFQSAQDAQADLACRFEEQVKQELEDWLGRDITADDASQIESLLEQVDDADEVYLYVSDQVTLLRERVAALQPQVEPKAVTPFEFDESHGDAGDANAADAHYIAGVFSTLRRDQ